MVIPEKVAKQLLTYPNVCGFAKTLQKRRRGDRVVDELCIQVHVRQKIKPENKLRKRDIIPKTIEDYCTDIVEVGDLKIPLPPVKSVAPSKTDRIRPLVAGVSVGNRAITAGSIGWFMEKTTMPSRGEVFLGSNAHVLCDKPEADSSSEKDILQPGSYDGGSEVVAEYFWHKQIIPFGQADCGVAKGVCAVLNGFAKLFRRSTRVKAYAEISNNIDFAVARMLTSYEPRFFDVEFPSDKFNFVGFGFAGSDTVSLVCKQEYIVNEGFKPVGYDGATVVVGDVVDKTGRTSCHTSVAVTVESAYEVVGYGSYYAAFDDVFMTGPLLQPGDSGSSVWKELL